MKGTKETSSPKPIDESEFLAAQAEKAKIAAIAALQQAKNDVKDAIQQNLDLRPTVRNHPMVAVGSATVAGFVAALLAVPSKEEQELRRLERIHRAMNPPPPSAASSNGDGKSNGQPAPPHSIWSSIIHEIVQLIRPILLTAITTGIKSATNPAPPVSPAATGQDPTNPA